MTTTIFLHDRKTLRVSFPYAPASVAAIKEIGEARWHPESRTWRVPLERLDALLSVFGDSAAVAPEVVMAAEAEQQEVVEPRRPATPEQRLQFFMDTLVWAGVSLRVEGPRVQGSGGCWTPILQAEIDKRAAQLRRLLEGGWQAPQAAPPPAAAPEPASYDLITHLDRVIAKGEQNARIAAEKEAGYKEAARRKRFDTMRQASLLEVEA